MTMQGSSGLATGRATVRDSEEELPPGGPPVVGAGDDLPRLDDLDALLVAVLVRRVGTRQLDLDLARTARVVRLDGTEIAERLPRALLDQLPRPLRRDLPRAEAAEPLLHGHGGQARAEQLARLLAGRAVAGHQEDRTAPRSAKRGIDPRLADEHAVEAQVQPLLPRDGVVHDAVGRARARVHPDEERRVAALLEEERVLRPVLLDDELAGRVEEVRDQRVEGPALARAVAVHDDDLGRAGGLRAADGGVDLLGVEPPTLLVHRVAARRLLPLHDPGDALHVADDVDAHARCSIASRSGTSSSVGIQSPIALVPQPRSWRRTGSSAATRSSPIPSSSRGRIQRCVSAQK